MAGIRTQIARIGNSQGIRIPKATLDQCRFAQDVILRPGEDSLVVRPAGQLRAGWEESFRPLRLRAHAAE